MGIKDHHKALVFACQALGLLVFYEARRWRLPTNRVVQVVFLK